MLAQIPNVITISRIILVVPIGYLLWDDQHMDAFTLMLIAGVSDAFDGHSTLRPRRGWLRETVAGLRTCFRIGETR